MILGSSDDLSNTPIIKHDFANDNSSGSLDRIHQRITTHDEPSYMNAQHLDLGVLGTARQAIEYANNNNRNFNSSTQIFLNKPNKPRGKRLYRSAENSPILSRAAMTNRFQQQQQQLRQPLPQHQQQQVGENQQHNQGHQRRERLDSITPRLDMQNIDKVGTPIF